MTARTLLQTLHDQGVILVPHPDGTLRCRAPRGVLIPALVDAIRQHKAALHGLVEACEERAALIEYDGRLPRAEAEALAWACLRGEGAS
jgi:hypothetical protein